MKFFIRDRYELRAFGRFFLEVFAPVRPSTWGRGWRVQLRMSWGTLRGGFARYHIYDDVDVYTSYETWRGRDREGKWLGMTFVSGKTQS